MPVDPVREPRVPAGLNLLIAGMVGTITLATLFLAPRLLAAGQGWAAWLVIPFAIAAVAHWGLVHEAVHGHLHPSPSINYRVAGSWRCCSWRRSTHCDSAICRIMR